MIDIIIQNVRTLYYLKKSFLDANAKDKQPEMRENELYLWMAGYMGNLQELFLEIQISCGHRSFQALRTTVEVP